MVNALKYQAKSFSFMKFIRDYNSYTNKSKQTTLI